MKLPAIQSNTGAFCLLELDDFPAICRQFALPTSDSQTPLQRLLGRLLMQELSPIASGVLLGPEFSYYFIEHKSPEAGLLLSLEKKADTPQPGEMPTLVPDWSVEHVRNNYAVATFELFYNPGEEQSYRKKQLLSELHSYCKHEEIDFFLKLITYPLPDGEENLFELQFAALSELRGFADLVAVEYFEDPLHAATITTHLDTPWVIFERNVSYETAKQTIRVGAENGAKGFVVSDVLWHDFAASLQGAEVTPLLLEQYVKTTVRDRLLELVRIVGE